jgi:hypothetical protein
VLRFHTSGTLERCSGRPRADWPLTVSVEPPRGWSALNIAGRRAVYDRRAEFPSAATSLRL